MRISPEPRGSGSRGGRSRGARWGRRGEIGRLPVSAEAKAFLISKRAARIPGPLTPLTARIIRSVYNRKRSPIVELEARFGVEASTGTAGGVEVCTMVPRDGRGADRYAIYLHGGAYLVGDARDDLAVLMAEALGFPLVSIQYRLSPEAAFPAALDDALAAYTATIEQRGTKFVLIGLSAGGGLALALMQRVRELGLPEPAGLGLLTPWTDLARVGTSYHSLEGKDPLIRWRRQLDKAARAYAAGRDVSDPLLSPVHAPDLSGFPPSMITTGTRDLFMSNCVRMYWALRAAEAPTHLRVWEGMWHSFCDQPDIPEAAECRDEVAAFLRRALDAAAG
ncbi:alpha/beta hydrolase [Nocardia beijingensis]|uniref:alpha/beta hydrolase n=1 Tax=Nocardia beijingensis TaxID=95162 RepID=UPI003330EF0D